MYPVTKSQHVSNVDTENVNTRSLSDLDSFATMSVCRVCLAMSVKMYRMSENKLSVMYKRVTGVEITPEDKLPKLLCWECVARLSSANKFLEKALKAERLLLNKINSGGFVTLSDIESIDRAHYQLQSTLGFQLCGENESNLYNIKENDYFYDKCKTEYCGLNDIVVSNEEEKNIIAETSESDEVPIKSEYIEGEEVDQNVANEDYDEVHISDDELKFQNTNTIQTLGISKHENISNEELVMDHSSNIIEVSEEANQEVLKQRGNIKEESATSEALPHRKELKLVLEDIMLTSSKHNTQDSLEHLTAHSSKDNGSVCYLQEKEKKMVVHVASAVDGTESSKQHFICDICEKQFNNKNALIQHIRNHPTMYGCTHCSYKTSYQNILKMHINCVHMKSTVFTCNYCSYVTHYKHSLSKHMNNVHTNIANDSYSGFTAYDKQTNKNIYYCSICNYKTNYKYILTRHINAQHSNTNVYYCSLCTFIAYNRFSLTEHVKEKHTVKNVFNCSLCNYKANNNITLCNHLITKHTKTVFNCSYCSFETHCQTQLNSHIKSLHS